MSTTDSLETSGCLYTWRVQRVELMITVFPFCFSEGGGGKKGGKKKGSSFQTVSALFRVQYNLTLRR